MKLLIWSIIKQQNLDENAVCGYSYPAPSNDHSTPSTSHSPYLLSPHLYDKGLFAALQSFTWNSTRDHSFNYQLFYPQFLAELWRKKLTDSQDSIFWLFYGTYKINPVWKLIERTKFLENLRLDEILSVKHCLNPQKNQEVIFPKRGVSQSLDYVYSLHPMPPSTNTIRELPFEAAEDQFSNNNPAFNVCAVRFDFRSIFLNCELTRWGQVEDRDQDQGWSSPGLHHQLPEPGDYFPPFLS